MDKITALSRDLTVSQTVIEQLIPYSLVLGHSKRHTVASVNYSFRGNTLGYLFPPHAARTAPSDGVSWRDGFGMIRLSGTRNGAPAARTAHKTALKIYIWAHWVIHNESISYVRCLCFLLLWTGPKKINK